ncbi:deacetylase-like protein [Thermodesulfatator indicus DSM 15286]|uniref:Deacetylase-like protein n=1 Tax=Thermodesulfatator indicus (strain DSM 15286 / JCM 11887 / CIR29812) TaxID=667014 RepID=F8AAV2_THEID|nr:polysaccharide deacetylase family protein [Thermodesulfatator indicus]AEH45463.1 deacetylase-like protein [Thermodesulfatator indicus DSM 15286]
MKKIIIELHDVSPFYKNEFFEALKLIFEEEINKYCILLIPNYKNKYNIEQHVKFTNLIKACKQEIILHGYEHTGENSLKYFWATNGEGEFNKLNKKETFKRIIEGKKIFKKLELKTSYFVPPAWISNKFLESALIKHDFKGISYREKINFFSKKKIFTPTITFSNRYLLSEISKWSSEILFQLFSKFPTIRFAIHMRDFHDNEKVKLWKKLIKKAKNRRTLNYEELYGES